MMKEGDITSLSIPPINPSQQQLQSFCLHLLRTHPHTRQCQYLPPLYSAFTTTSRIICNDLQVLRCTSQGSGALHIY